MFTNQDLKKLIIPLFLEQLLVALVGIADVFVIGFVGEAAVSGVSLVNAFNMIFINLFTALASGGAVVISQYIGKKDKEQAGAAASQLLTASVLLSVVISVVVLVANEQLMRLMFGKVEDDVMAACVTYLRISAYSYPAMAIYNAGAALYRSFGKTSTTMYLSIASNVINVVGNCIGVFALHAGVPGVAVPSLIARIFSAAVITVLCFSKRNPVQYRSSERYRERYFPARQSSTFQCGSTVWYLPDCRKRHCPEYMVHGGTHKQCTFPSIHHRHRTVHGRGRY